MKNITIVGGGLVGSLPADLMGMMTHPDTVAAAFANLG